MTLPNGGAVAFDGESTYTLTWPDGSIVQLDVWGFNDRWMDANVSLADARADAVTGLVVGNMDGKWENDLTSADGSVLNIEELSYENLYDDFGDSWRIHQADSLFDYDAGESTETFTDLDFPAEVVNLESLSEEERQDAEQVCRDSGVTKEPFLTACVLDVALTGDPGFAEATAALQEAASAVPTPTGDGQMHLEVTGDLEETIDLAFDRESSSYFPPDGTMTLYWRNDADQRLVFFSRVSTGTRTGVLVQMNLFGGPGFSHNAFGDQCEVTVTEQEETMVAGTLSCVFDDVAVEGSFDATF